FPPWPGLSIALLRLLHPEIVQSLNRRLLGCRVPPQVAFPFRLMEAAKVGVVGKRGAVVIKQELPLHHDLAPAFLFGKLEDRAGDRRYFFDAELFGPIDRSEEHTSELQSRGHLVCRLLLEKKKKKKKKTNEI